MFSNGLLSLFIVKNVASVALLSLPRCPRERLETLLTGRKAGKVIHFHFHASSFNLHAPWHKFTTMRMRKHKSVNLKS